MKDELTEVEREFIKDCIYIAAREGFWAIDTFECWEELNRVAVNVLVKMGEKRSTAEEFMRYC